MTKEKEKEMQPQVEQQAELPLAYPWTGDENDPWKEGADDFEHYDEIIDSINNYLVDEFFKDYFVTWDGGITYVVKNIYVMGGVNLDTPQPDLEFSRGITDLSKMFINKKFFVPIRKTNKNGDRYLDWKKTDIAKYWFEETDRPTYSGVIFYPSKYGEENKVSDQLRDSNGHAPINLFKEWGCKPDFEDSGEKCQLIRNHLFHSICSGETNTYEWLMTWLANKVQKPNDKIGSVPAISGGQGSGKSIFFAQVLGKIIGRQSFVHTNDVNRVTARFSCITPSTMICFMDEALFVGVDKQSQSRLKALTTEKTLTFEEKYKNTKATENRVDFVIATNNLKSAPIEYNDRRYCILRSTNQWTNEVEKEEYFTALVKEIENGGVEAFFAFLLQYDLDEAKKRGVNIKRGIETKYTAEQKQMNLDEWAQWWQDVLTEESLGNIAPNPSQHTEIVHFADIENKVVPKPVLYQSFMNWHNRRSRSQAYETQQTITIRLKEMNPSISDVSQKPVFRNDHPFYCVLQGSRPTCVQIPTLEVCRAEYEKNIVKVEEWNLASGASSSDGDEQVDASGINTIGRDWDDIPF